MNKSRKRPKKILPIIKLFIASKAIEELGETREKLAGDLIEEITRLWPKETPPAWETVIKLISKARNSSREVDKPWHLSTLDDYPISSKTIAQIFELKTQGLRTMTIRDAQWLDRLSSIRRLPLEILCRLAQLLSLNEKYSKISKDAFDTNYWEKKIVSLLGNSEERESMIHILRTVPEGLDIITMSEIFRESLKQSKKEAQ